MKRIKADDPVVLRKKTLEELKTLRSQNLKAVVMKFGEKHQPKLDKCLSGVPQSQTPL
jgi:hypothetical protein